MTGKYNYSHAPYLLRPRLLQLIRGIRGPRQNELTLKQICKYFSATPEQLVKDELDDLVVSGHVDIRRTALSRSHNTQCVYCLSESGERVFQSYVRDHACYTG